MYEPVITGEDLHWKGDLTVELNSYKRRFSSSEVGLLTDPNCDYLVEYGEEAGF